jgi:TonB family protein
MLSCGVAEAQQSGAPPSPARPKADLEALADMLADSYPSAAISEWREGETTVSACIGADGQARDEKLVKSSGHADLDEATVKGIPTVPFNPARDATGKPVDWCEPPYKLTIGWRLPDLAAQSEFERRPMPDPSGMAALLIDYPAPARRNRIEGDVVVSMCVGADGRAHDIKLVKSSGNKPLDDASLKGALKVRFRPGRDPSGNAVDWCDPPHVMTIRWRLPR